MSQLPAAAWPCAHRQQGAAPGRSQRSAGTEGATGEGEQEQGRGLERWHPFPACVLGCPGQARGPAAVHAAMEGAGGTWQAAGGSSRTAPSVPTPRSKHAVGLDLDFCSPSWPAQSPGLLLVLRRQRGALESWDSDGAAQDAHRASVLAVPGSLPFS